jgi:hypothetical protein
MANVVESLFRGNFKVVVTRAQCVAKNRKYGNSQNGFIDPISGLPEQVAVLWHLLGPARFSGKARLSERRNS